MSNLIGRLREVHNLDNELRRYRSYRDTRPSDLQEKERECTDIDRQRVLAEEKKKDINLKIRHVEGQVRELEEKVDRFKGQQGQVKTNQEFHALKSEILGCEADISRLEDQTLEFFESNELCDQEISGIEERLATKKAEMEVLRKEVEKDLLGIDQEIKDFESKREEAAAHVDDHLLEDYENLLSGRGGTAMSEVADGFCQECSVQVIPNQLNLLSRGDTIVKCKLCGRILYLQD